MGTEPILVGEPIQHFSEMRLSQVSLEALAKAGFAHPTPIQSALIPQALAGHDVIGQARTGTGKTAAFLLPIFEALDAPASGARPQAIILVPTRELAAQVETEAIKLSHGRKLRTVVLSGGKPIRRQIQQLSDGVEIVIGTPGRVIDHIGRGTLGLDAVRFVVLDEADRMLDIGFRPDIEKILRRVPRKRQTMLLSATVPAPVERLAQRYMIEPQMVNRSSTEVSGDTIDQYYISVDPQRKFEALVRLLHCEKPKQAIVFCRTKRGTDKITKNLTGKFEGVSSIHGDMQQRVRDRVMEQFRQGDIRCLVATDVMGRGIDVSSISHIINYDIPEFCDDYVHRVGRTGRMGRAGTAYTLVAPDEGPQLTSIEMRINRMLERYKLDGFEDVAIKPVVSRPIGAEAAEMGAEAGGEANPPADLGAETRKPVAPLLGKGRAPRRFRRGL